MGGISLNDVDKKCNYYMCKKCILPCNSCVNSRCEQCEYGYKTIIEILIIRYSQDVLESYKDTCVYAKLVSEKIKSYN